jgi:hypothetical protein
MPATNWQAAFAATITVNGTNPSVQEASYSEEASEFDATVINGPVNSNGLLQAQNGNDVITTKVEFTILLDPTAVVNIALGVPYSATIAFTNEQTHTGTVRFSSRNKGIATKGAYQRKYQGTFTGAVSGQ